MKFSKHSTVNFGRPLRWLSLGVVQWLITSQVQAGMPSPRLIVTELGKRRFEEISFFLVGFLVLTAFCRWIWNGLAKEIPSWPILSFRAALSLMLLWGLALTVVLSLVSGARELMTPAAWEPNGITYKLGKPGETNPSPAKVQDLTERRRRIELVRRFLWDHAEQHEQEFPNDLSGLSSEMAVVDPVSEQNYILMPHLTKASSVSVLVREPDVFSQRLLLLTDGTIAVEERSEGGVP